MNIVIPTFTNPFSFHCLKRDTIDNVNIDSCVPEYSSFSSFRSKTEWSDLSHGQVSTYTLNNLINTRYIYKKRDFKKVYCTSQNIPNIYPFYFVMYINFVGVIKFTFSREWNM